MTAWREIGPCRIACGDCLAVMPTLPEASIDAVVTDPPYGLSFMGKDWDWGVPGEAFWREAIRVAKPGAHLLAFGGTRTFHRLMVAIEDAGWEIRDTIMWVYGSGFPKSLDVSKAIDKAAGAERERIRGVRSGVVNATYAHDAWSQEFKDSVLSSEPLTPEAAEWNGWGTALKPAWEPIILARKPIESTVAANVLKYGTGGINVDGCRVGTEDRVDAHHGTNGGAGKTFGDRKEYVLGTSGTIFSGKGRFPANLIHDGSEEVVGLFPVSESIQSMRGERHGNIYGNGDGPSGPDSLRGHCDSGSAARFFYCAKASKDDRGEGNNHPTVKPTALMRYLCRLITPPGGLVLDPFAGSGSTGKACVLEGFRFAGIELNPEYCTIAEARIRAEVRKRPLFSQASSLQSQA